MFFKRGEIVVVDEGAKRWCVDAVVEGYNADGDAVAYAQLSDESGGQRRAETSRLTKVAG